MWKVDLVLCFPLQLVAIVVYRSFIIIIILNNSFLFCKSCEIKFKWASVLIKLCTLNLFIQTQNERFKTNFYVLIFCKLHVNGLSLYYVCLLSESVIITARQFFSFPTN